MGYRASDVIVIAELKVVDPLHVIVVPDTDAVTLKLVVLLIVMTLFPELCDGNELFRRNATAFANPGTFTAFCSVITFPF
jgi:hypothetical protein